MKRDVHRLTGRVLQLKRKPVSFLEMHSPEGDSKDPLLDMIEITDLEGPGAEFPVPANFV